MVWGRGRCRASHHCAANQVRRRAPQFIKQGF